MGGLEQLVSVLGLSFASGVNLYLTVLLLGLAQRFAWFSFLPEGLAVLGDPIVLWTAGILYALEFFADKVPFVSTIWDGFHTFIRPLGAALLALGAADEYGAVGQVVAVLIAGSIALGSHTTKATTRVLAHTAPEPATHSAISIAEDLGVFGLIALVFNYPLVALVVLIVLLGAMAVVTPMLLRTLRFVMASLFGYLFGSRNQNGIAAPDHVAKALGKLDESAEWRIFPAFARNVPGSPRLGRGHLAVSAAQVVFVRGGLLSSRATELGAPGALELQSGMICDIAVATPGGGDEIRVCLTKNWARALRSGSPQSAGGLAPAAG